MIWPSFYHLALQIGKIKADVDYTIVKLTPTKVSGKSCP